MLRAENGLESRLKTKADATRQLSVSLTTVNRMIDSGLLPVVRIGRSVRIEATHIDRIAEAGTAASTLERNK